MKPRTILSVPILILLLFAIGIPTRAQSGTASFTSMWNDYKTSVPEGWKISSDREGDSAFHYADTTFKSGDYSLSIRWYTRYSTHRLPSQLLEMYSGVDDYISKTAGPQCHWDNSVGQLCGTPEIVTPVHDLTASEYPSFKSSAAKALAVRSNYKKASNPGDRAYALIPTQSGFYVLIYSAPLGGLDKYKGLYEEMVSSFVPVKDGPSGPPMYGQNGKPLSEALLPKESPEQTLQRYVSPIKAQREQELSERICKQETGLDSRGDLATITKCSPLFIDVGLRKQIIELAVTMQPAPALSEEAKRGFVEANVFLKGAKSAADYNLAVNKYKEALIEAPWWGLAYNNLGIALKAAGRLDDAKTALELYLLTKPADASTAQITIYEIGGQQQLDEQHQLQEKDQQGQCWLETTAAATAMDKGSSGYNDAIQHYKKAAELCPDPKTSVAAYARLGDLYRRQGDLDDAYKYMQKAFELDPNPQGNERWRYTNFGVLLHDRGDHPGACQFYRKGCNAGLHEACDNLRTTQCQ
jgi:tetratricopeptide (TPR) repeat protein